MAKIRTRYPKGPERVPNKKRGMVAKFEETPGFRVVTETGMSPIMQQLTTADFSLSPGPLISGNFRSPNNWTYLVIRNYGGTGTTVYQSSNYFQKSLGDFGVNVLGVAEPKDRREWAYRLALDRLNERVRGNLDLSTGLAEMGQTRKMLSLSRVSVANFAAVSKAFSRKRNAIRSVLGLGKFMGDKWLEYQYGWRPLINDLYGAADESLRYVVNRIKRVNASASVPYGPQMMSISSVLGPARIPVPFEGLGGVRFSLHIDQGNDVDLQRWTSLNPVSIAWELMPYSFVVDWFYDIGGYLRAAETSLLSQGRFQSGYVTRMNAYVRLIPSVAQRSGQTIAEVKNNSRSLIEFSRGVLTSYPFPRRPMFHVDLGSEQMLSAAALLGQFVSGKSPSVPTLSKAESRMYKKYFKNSVDDFRNLND